MAQYLLQHILLFWDLVTFLRMPLYSISKVAITSSIYVMFVSTMKNVGVLLDNHLNFNQQIITLNFFHTLRNLREISCL